MEKLGFETFIKELADSPANLAFVEAHFNGADQAAWDEFLELVDQSDFSLRDWVEAMRVIGQWLDGRGLRMEFGDQVGYVSCASASAGAGANLAYLPGLVDEMLTTYGCERAVKK
ncbi:MAG: hypothetical protein ACSHYA_16955 [Opitutaceae bacterium]